MGPSTEWGPPQSGSPGTADFGAYGVRIPSNLLISSCCLGLSGLNLTEGGGAGLVGLGGLRSREPAGLVSKALGGLARGAGVCGGGGGLF